MEHADKNTAEDIQSIAPINVIIISPCVFPAEISCEVGTDVCPGDCVKAAPTVADLRACEMECERYPVIIIIYCCCLDKRSSQTILKARHICRACAAALFWCV